MIDSHNSRTTNAAQWFWKVDPVFGAWVCRTSRRAEQSNADLPGVRVAVAIIREYLEMTFPGCWAEVERLSNGPVKLDDAITIDVIEFARFEIVPKWEGWAKAAERLDLARGGATGKPEAEPGPVKAKPTRRADRDDRPKLFG